MNLILAEGDNWSPWVIGVSLFILIVLLVIFGLIFQFLGLYVRAYVSRAPVSLFELIGMRLRKLNAVTIVNARIPHLVYGCPDPKAGAVATLYQLCTDPRLNHRVKVDAGIRAPECSTLLTQFFAAKRAQGKK